LLDGHVFERKGFLAMGGQSDQLNADLQSAYDQDMELDAALQLAMRVLRQAAPAGETNSRLEVAVLERDRPRRAGPRRPPPLFPAPAPGGGRARGRRAGVVTPPEPGRPAWLPQPGPGPQGW